MVLLPCLLKRQVRLNESVNAAHIAVTHAITKSFGEGTDPGFLKLVNQDHEVRIMVNMVLKVRVSGSTIHTRKTAKQSPETLNL